jgi:hypothetical protein
LGGYKKEQFFMNQIDTKIQNNIESMKQGRRDIETKPDVNSK